MTVRYRSPIVAALVFALSATANAHDLGVRGKVWPIAEPDILVRMVQAASRVNWNEIQRHILASARYWLHHLPDVGIPAATRTRTHYKDPSIIIQQNIEVPVRKPNGGYTYRVLYPKGTKVNPLETGIRPETRMLFFDPKDKGQWAFAKAAKQAFPYRIILVTTSGNLAGMAKEIGQPVFYSVPKLAGRLGVDGVPALIGVGEGAHEFDIAVTTFDSATVADLAHIKKHLQAAWYGITEAHLKATASSRAN